MNGSDKAGGRSAPIQNGLQGHFAKHLSASNFSAISNLEPGKDLNPAHRGRTLNHIVRVVWHICIP